MPAEILDNLPIIDNANAQAQLVKLLSTELNSAFIMLKTAEVDASLDLVSRIALLAKLRSTLRIVRRFEARVEDAILALQIKARAVELESAMRGLQANGEFATERRTR